MHRATWTNERALTFARGLYYVAVCDGLVPIEREALAGFLARVGLPPDVDALADPPFELEEAARALHTTWLRRTFVRACRLMAQIDGEVTPAERDALRSLAAALGVDQHAALDDLGPGAPDARALAEWIGGLAVDFVSWNEEAQPGYFWAFPHAEHPLAEGGELLVEHGQALVVMDGDAVADVLEPGTYRVSPALWPKLAAARGWQGGQVRARLLFLRTSSSPQLRWGTADPALVELPGHGRVELRAFGRFSVRVIEPQTVAERMARAEIPSDESFEQRVRRIVSGRFAQALEGNAWSADPIAELNDLDALTAQLRGRVEAALNGSGLSLTRFVMENLTAPLELGLQPTSRKTTSLTRIGRELLGRSGSDEAPRDAIKLRPCPRCISPIPLRARFCPRCGAAQPARCAACGHELTERARFCADCGTPVDGAANPG